MSVAGNAGATGSEDDGRPTADRILVALIDVILEGGLPGFSVQEVADRAGVAHRTVYRHFPTREALLEGLAEAVGRRMAARGGVERPEVLGEVPAAALANFALFSRDARAVEASVRFGVGTATETRERRRRTDRFRELVARDIPGLSPADATLAAAAIRQAVSSRSWLALREAGLDAGAAARTAAWTVAVLTDALRAGRTPTREPFSTSSAGGAKPSDL